MKRIDPVAIKLAVSKGQIGFYDANGIIYCRDTETEEITAVGKTMAQVLKEPATYKKIVVNAEEAANWQTMRSDEVWD